MKKIDSIAEFSAEMFVQKHFSALSKKDIVVKTMKESVKDTILQALIAFELQKT